jgi:glucose dehydrogenase
MGRRDPLKRVEIIMTRQSNSPGVIAAGGHGSFGTKLGDYVIAHALPQE